MLNTTAPQTPSVVLTSYKPGHHMLVVNEDVALRSEGLLAATERTVNVAGNAIAEDQGCKLQRIQIPEVFNERSDGVEADIKALLRKMGAFKPGGSIFHAIESSDVMTLDGVILRDRLMDDWLPKMHQKWVASQSAPNPDFSDAVVWGPASREDCQYLVTFQELCDSEYLGDGVWRLTTENPHYKGSHGQAKRVTLTVSFYDLKPFNS